MSKLKQNSEDISLGAVAKDLGFENDELNDILDRLPVDDIMDDGIFLLFFVLMRNLCIYG